MPFFLPASNSCLLSASGPGERHPLYQQSLLNVKKGDTHVSTQQRFQVWRLPLDQHERSGGLAHTMVDYHGASANSKEEAKTARNHVHGVYTDTHRRRTASGDGTSFTLHAHKALLYFLCAHLTLISSVCCGRHSTQVVTNKRGCGNVDVGRCAARTGCQRMGGGGGLLMERRQAAISRYCTAVA